jgi:hypothetical protein
VSGAFYTLRVGEGNQILQDYTSKSVDTIRGHSTRSHRIGDPAAKLASVKGHIGNLAIAACAALPASTRLAIGLIVGAGLAAELTAVAASLSSKVR